MAGVSIVGLIRIPLNLFLGNGDDNDPSARTQYGTGSSGENAGDFRRCRNNSSVKLMNTPSNDPLSYCSVTASPEREFNSFGEPFRPHQFFGQLQHPI